MWAGLALAVACASDPAPPAPAAKDATRTWRRIGSTADGAAPEAATAEAARCASPCVAELWEPTSDASAATSIVLLRSDSEMRAADRRGVWQTTWRGLSGTLALCLGDPLATPPAGDPAGFRLLHAREGQWAWSVHLSGANPCGLDGQIELAAHGHRVRTHDLRAATLPWADGGREGRSSGRETPRTGRCRGPLAQGRRGRTSPDHRRAGEGSRGGSPGPPTRGEPVKGSPRTIGSRTG